MGPTRNRCLDATRQAVAMAVASAIALSGCAARGTFLQQQSPVASNDRSALQPSESYARYIQSVPIGSRVKVILRSGERLDAVLIEADEAIVVLKPRTRIPEPERRVPIREIASMELHTSEGMGVGKAILIGVAAGGAAILTILLITLSAGWD